LQSSDLHLACYSRIQSLFQHIFSGFLCEFLYFSVGFSAARIAGKNGIGFGEYPFGSFSGTGKVLSVHF
jgi:hypothetical protein